MTCQHFFIVMTADVEPGYPEDPLSLPCETYGFTVHTDPGEARRTWLAALEADLHAGALRSLRRSVVVEADVPETMMRNGCPRRWISDRMRWLASRGGLEPGKWSAAFHRGSYGHLVLADVRRTISLLAQVMDGAQRPDGYTDTATAAMSAAAAAARAGQHACIEAGLARQLIALMRGLASSFEPGTDASYMRPALDALVQMLPESQEPEDSQPRPGTADFPGTSDTEGRLAGYALGAAHFSRVVSEMRQTRDNPDQDSLPLDTWKTSGLHSKPTS